MKTLFEILKVILPAIITGLFTFLITKYTYNRNIPLDKLEITYNRIYYPLYKIISDKNISENINEVINQSRIYITKYDKYVDASTKRLFQILINCDKEVKKKSIYHSFKDNIYNRNSYLRRKLGYLEPNFIQLYKYSTPATKSFFRITMELCVVCISIFLCDFTIDKFDTLFNISIVIFVVFTLLIVYESIYGLLRILYYQIRK